MPIQINQVLKNATEVLGSVSDTPQLDAELLLVHVLHQPRSYLYTYPEKLLTEKQMLDYADCLSKRAKGEPIAYITGTKSFWTLELEVTPDVLIPRPETELLVETVLSLLSEDEDIKLADLGTGSGAIALALAYERPRWQIYATDVSENALSIASNNAQQLGLNNVAFYRGNWCTALPCDGFDVIVSNPPYIAEKEWGDYALGLQCEPREALVSGEEGLDAIMIIAETAGNYLKPGGYLLVEHGYEQGPAVRRIFQVFGLTDVMTLKDLSGQDRVTIGKKTI